MTYPRHKTKVHLDKVFDVLSHQDRRHALLQLYRHSPCDFAAMTNETAADSRVEFYHRHLPKLKNAGLAEFDPDTDTIRRGPCFSDISPLLEVLVQHGDGLPDG